MNISWGYSRRQQWLPSEQRFPIVALTYIFFHNLKTIFAKTLKLGEAKEGSFIQSTREQILSSLLLGIYGSELLCFVSYMMSYMFHMRCFSSICLSFWIMWINSVVLLGCILCTWRILLKGRLVYCECSRVWNVFYRDLVVSNEDERSFLRQYGESW